MEHAYVVDKESGRKIVAAVGHHVVGTDHLHSVVRGDALIMTDNLDVWVDGAHRFRGADYLGPVDISGTVKDLALQV